MVSPALTPIPQDPADIGEEDLWAAWVQRPAFLVETGMEPVSVEWMLAARGEEGLSALSSREGFGEALLAALPLATLRHIALALPQETESALPKWVRTALGTSTTLIFASNINGSTRIVADAKDLQPGEKELLKGSRKDFDEVLSEGNRIFQEKDWAKIFGDMRPFVKQGEVGWLDHHVDPEGAQALDEFIRIGRGEQ